MKANNLKSLVVYRLKVISLIVTTLGYISVLNAQKTPRDFVLGTYASTNTIQNGVAGYGQNFTGTNYTLQYGAASSGSAGFNRVVKLFAIDGEAYSVTKAVPGEKPFSNVVINRKNNAQVSGIKTTAFFETSASQNTGNNSTVYLTPDYVNTMEDLINSYIVNRGSDNIFVADAGSSTRNNVERIDMLLANPVNINAVNSSTSGFLFMERGTGDPFKIAAITGAAGSGSSATASAFASPLTIANSSYWGNTGTSITTLVMMRNGTTGNLQPSQNIGAQTIRGVFVSLADLGLTAGTTLYGISAFANDVTATTSAQLLNIASDAFYPPLTLDAAGGLDFTAGGGFFTKAILVKGNVWNDADGNASQSGAGETGIANGLWANLVDPSGNVVSSVLVQSNGTYTLFVADNQIAAGSYSVIITNTEKYEGTTLNQSDTPGNNYGYTGTNTGGTANAGNRTGVVTIGAISGSDIENVNFGISNDPAVLPVDFGGFSATISGNQLLVNWSTLSETNSSYFEVEASKDGKIFKSLGKTDSKAIGGNSETIITYEFTVGGANSANSLLGLSVLSIALAALLTNRKNKILFMLAIVSGSCLFTVACAKKDINSVETDAQLYIRIKQVDKDGAFKYSKIITAISK